MAELPVLPIATAALISDTTHMSAEEFGAYVRVLMAMWAQGAELPDNDAQLARIAGVTPKRWQSIRPVVLAPVAIDAGKLSQKRLTKTWEHVQDKRGKVTTAALKRWSNRNADAYAKPMQGQQCSSNAIKIKKDITTSETDAAREGHRGEPGDKSQKPTIAASDGLAEVIAKKGWVA